MFKKLLAATVLCLSAISTAFAIDVNTATPEDLAKINGIGPKTALKIVEARKDGRFVDQKDLADRVTGIGEKSAARFVKEGGLTFGQPS